MSTENDMYRKKFANNLNYYMRINGKIQDDLVKDLKIKSSTVSSWCTAQKLPRMDKIIMLANYFNIHFSKLIDENTNINYFEFTIEDEAMYPILDVGDTATIQKQTNIENNKYYLILFNNQKTIRKIVLDNNKYILSGINSYCKEIVISQNEFSKIQVLGKVTEARNKSAFK